MFRVISVKLEAVTTGFANSVREARNSVTAFGQEIEKASRTNAEGFNTLGLAATAAGVAIGGALGLSARSAVQFESSFAGVRKTVDGTDRELEALAKGFREMAKEVPLSVNELNRIGEAAGQLGIQTDNILGFTRVMADLGVSTNLSADQAAVSLAQLANITQMPQENFDRLGSTIVALGNNLATNEAEIVSFGQRIAGAGEIAGLTESEILAIGGAMASVGVEAEAGGTAVQKVLLGMTDAVARGGDGLGVFAATAGMSADQFREAWQSDSAGAFTAFVEGLDRAGTDAFVILEQLGLADERLIRGFLSLAGAGDTLRSSIELGSEAWEANAALTEEARKRYETTQAQIQLAQNSINDLAIELGNVLLPVLRLVADAGGNVADFFAAMPGPVKVASVAVGGLAAAALLFGGVTLTLVPKIAATQAALSSMGITATRAGAAMRASAGLMAAGGPFGIALVGATAAIALLGSATDDTKRSVEEMTAAIEADSGALAANTRAYVANKLEKDGLLQTAREMGVALDDLVSAALGDEAALRRVNAATDATVAAKAKAGDTSRDWLQMEAQLLLAVMHTTEEVDSATTAAARKADAMGKAADGADAAAGATGRYGDAVGGAIQPTLDLGAAGEDTGQKLRDAFIDAAEAAENHRDAERDIADAERALSDAQEELNELRRKGAVDAKEVADAERDVAQAKRGVADAQKRLNELQNPSGARAAQRGVDRQKAIRAVEDAEKHLSAVQAAGGAPNAVRDATIELGDARAGLLRLDEDDAQHAEDVARARDDLAEAQRGEREALDRLAEAKRGDVDWSRKVEDAVRTVQDAEEQLRDRKWELVLASYGARDASDAYTSALERAGAVAQAYRGELEAIKRVLEELGMSAPTVPQAGGASSTGGGGTPRLNQADGGIVSFASGGLSAGFATAPTILFGERETGGEAFIPMGLGKRGRSTQVLREVADQFGYELAARGAGQSARSFGPQVVVVEKSTRGDDVDNWDIDLHGLNYDEFRSRLERDRRAANLARRG